MAAAKSSKAQWRAFLLDLVRSNNPGHDCKLTPRLAFAELSKQFGSDVGGDDRRWAKGGLDRGPEGRTTPREERRASKKKARATWVAATGLRRDNEDDDDDDDELRAEYGRTEY